MKPLCRFRQVIRCALLALIASLLLSACGPENKSTTKPASIRERQDKALQDPMNYKVDPGKRDVSGGDTWKLDKEGLKRDWDHVINP